MNFGEIIMQFVVSNPNISTNITCHNSRSKINKKRFGIASPPKYVSSQNLSNLSSTYPKFLKLIL